jgi:hypothetical protein
LRPLATAVAQEILQVLRPVYRKLWLIRCPVRLLAYAGAGCGQAISVLPELSLELLSSLVLLLLFLQLLLELPVG